MRTPYILFTSYVLTFKKRADLALNKVRCESVEMSKLDKMYRCECGEVFSNNSQRGNHLGKGECAYGDGPDKRTCPVCSKLFSRSDTMRKHLKSHGDFTTKPETWKNEKLIKRAAEFGIIPPANLGPPLSKHGFIQWYSKLDKITIVNFEELNIKCIQGFVPKMVFRPRWNVDATTPFDYRMRKDSLQSLDWENGHNSDYGFHWWNAKEEEDCMKYSNSTPQLGILNGGSLQNFARLCCVLLMKGYVVWVATINDVGPEPLKVGKDNITSPENITKVVVVQEDPDNPTFRCDAFSFSNRKGEDKVNRRQMLTFKESMDSHRTTVAEIFKRTNVKLFEGCEGSISQHNYSFTAEEVRQLNNYRNEYNKSIPKSKSFFITGAPPNVTEANLYELFKSAQLLPESVAIYRNKEGFCTGTVICNFSTCEEVGKALSMKDDIFGIVSSGITLKEC